MFSYRLPLYRSSLIFLFALLLSLLLFQPRPTTPTTLHSAVAKGRIVNIKEDPQLQLDETLVKNLSLQDTQTAIWLADKQFDFLYAHPLNPTESTSWRSFGCDEYNCAHATFYNYTDGGTVETVTNLDSNTIIARWQNPFARPRSSERILPKALHILSQNKSVTQLLGSINYAEIMMVPTSAWLADNDCAQDWCVDLTYFAPDQSGEVLHIFINLQKEEVARTFYTRARPPRGTGPNQSPPTTNQTGEYFKNGCRKQYGWDVCWRMTADDGIDFQNGSHQDNPVFRSIKIGQIEAWYPSWPGGYRDEIGYRGPVWPYFGTRVTDLGFGFSVSQLYSEYQAWPNCICCYRYEQIITFYADGSFKPEFISHGPGCDEPSTYRPFWRIDLSLPETEEISQLPQQVWAWQQTHWVETKKEISLNLFDLIAPEKDRIVTFNGYDYYHWYPEETDPLGNDEGRLYIIRHNFGEGDGPILAGAANTWKPPAQWVDDEPLADGDTVVWYIPSLNTMKGGPWWCVPDPEPAFSPCNASMLIAPLDPIDPNLISEVEIMITRTPKPTVPAPPAPTPRPIEGENLTELLQNAGCINCHKIAALGQDGKVGPDLTSLSAVASSRVPNLTAEQYIRQSILSPNSFIVRDCPNGPCRPNIMPQNYADRLSEPQINGLVAFLLDQNAIDNAESVQAPWYYTPTQVALSFFDWSQTNQLNQSLLIPIILGIVILLVAILLWRTRSWLKE